MVSPIGGRIISSDPAPWLMTVVLLAFFLEILLPSALLSRFFHSLISLAPVTASWWRRELSGLSGGSDSYCRSPDTEKHLRNGGIASFDLDGGGVAAFRCSFRWSGWYSNFCPFLFGSKWCSRACSWISRCCLFQEKMKLFLPSRHSSVNCEETFLFAQSEITPRSSSSSPSYLLSPPITMMTFPPDNKADSNVKRRNST